MAETTTWLYPRDGRQAGSTLPTFFIRKIPFIVFMVREIKSAYFHCFFTTLGCVSVHGVFTEERTQHFDHHHSVFVHLFCYWSSAFPGNIKIKWKLV